MYLYVAATDLYVAETCLYVAAMYLYVVATYSYVDLMYLYFATTHTIYPKVASLQKHFGKFYATLLQVCGQHFTKADKIWVILQTENEQKLNATILQTFYASWDTSRAKYVSCCRLN